MRTWLDPGTAIDLLDVAGSDGWFWERDRAGLAGRGIAARIPLPGGLADPGAPDIVAGALRDLGEGLVAVGALPFDRHTATELLVPEVVVGRRSDGRYWMAVAGNADGQGVIESLTRADPQDPDGFELSSPIAHTKWMDLVAAAVDAIGDGRFDKVVLAREVLVNANRSIDVPTVLRRLRSLYPACTVVSTPAAGHGQFVAASPELLVSRHGRELTAHPLAGTIPRSGEPEADRALAESLLNSPKDRAEHAWVVRDVDTALRPWCDELDVPEAPSIVALRNVSHLGTLIRGRLRDGDVPSALGLAAALHPTAAVGGTPREAALDWLDANEGFERGPYAGPVGWVDASGDGEFVVGIRSAVVDGAQARLFAGVGVVDGSDPATELAETQFKLQALLAAVVRP
jgi:menaquinone-specific isochorismate synthase